MCPACLATAAMIAAGATSTGGITALAVKKLLAKRGEKSRKPKTRSEGELNAPAENRIPR